MYSYSRSRLVGTVTASQDGLVGTGIAQGYVFQLNDVPNANEFTVLYDQYMLTAVKVTFRPMVNQVVAGAPNTGYSGVSGFPPLNSVIDYDDNAAPPALSTVLQYQNLRTTNPNRTHTRLVRPRMLGTALSAAATQLPVLPKRAWIDCNVPNILHYGLKVFMDAPPVVAGANSSMSYQVYMTYYIKFKNVR